MALRNRTDCETDKLRGVDLSTADTKLEFGKFRELQNWIPAKVYSIKKKRGVQRLISPGGGVVFPTQDCSLIGNPGGGGGGGFAGLVYTCGYTCPLTQYAQLTYDGGDEPAGPIIRVSSGSTPGSLFGLAAIYNPTENAVAMVRWEGGPRIAVEVVVEPVEAELVVGDVLRIEAATDDPESYSVKINGTTVIGPRTISNDLLPILNSCVGSISVVEVPDFVDDGLTPTTVESCPGATFDPTNFSPIPLTGTFFAQTLVDVTINSRDASTDCYGVHYADGYNASGFPTAQPGDYIEFEIPFDGVIAGTPRSGAAWRITGNDPDSMECWCAIADFTDETFKLMYYSGESMSDLPDPNHIVASVPMNTVLGRAFAQGDYINITHVYYQDADWNPETIYFYVYDIVNDDYVEVFTYEGANYPTPGVIPHGSQEAERQSNTNWGFCSIGTGSANVTDSARWHDSTEFNAGTYAVID